MITGNLQSALNRLRPGVPVVKPMRARHRRNRGQSIGKFRHRFVIEIRPRNMNQLRSLLLDCSHHFRMTMAGRIHSDACGEIHKLIAINIFDANTAPPLRHQRGTNGCSWARSPVHRVRRRLSPLALERSRAISARPCHITRNATYGISSNECSAAIWRYPTTLARKHRGYKSFRLG